MDREILERALETIRGDFLDLGGRENLAAPRAPETLYHYTSAEGLTGILQTGELWATNVLYLNDAAEFVDPIDTLKTVLEEECKDLPDLLGFLIRSLIPAYLEESPIDYFAVCFCEDGDLLSQWRAYGTRGTGYSVGFATAALVELTSSPASVLQKIEYDARGKAEVISARVSVVKRVLEPIASKLAFGNSEDLRIVGDFFSKIAVLFTPKLAFMKHPTFAEEREWRLVIQQPRSIHGSRPPGCLPVRFRVADGKISPYVSLVWNQRQSDTRGAVAEIRHGPISEPALAQRVLADLLAECGLRGVTVSGSGIPLRA